MVKPKYIFQQWPSWRYGPNGQAAIFDHEEQVPEGWEDHPSKVADEDGPEGSPSAASEPRTGSTVATDPTRGGEVNANRGTPETAEEEGGGTTGGETAQPATTSLFKLPPITEVDKTWIAEQLSARKIPHNPRWRLQKLYDLLHDAVSPGRPKE